MKLNWNFQKGGVRGKPKKKLMRGDMVFFWNNTLHQRLTSHGSGNRTQGQKKNKSLIMLDKGIMQLKQCCC